MRIFALELKKLFNWKICLAVLLLGGLTYVAYLSSAIYSYNTMNGIYGDYQREMFEKYGGTLEPNEYADFDVPGKMAELTRQLDELIKGEATYAKYGINSFADYESGLSAFMNKYLPNGSGSFPEPYATDYHIMTSTIYGVPSPEGMPGVYVVIGGQEHDGPYSNLQHLKTIEHDYESDDWVVNYLSDERPVVHRQMEVFLAETPRNLINYDLTGTFAMYAAIVAVFAVLASLLLIAPFITTDRAGKMQYLQYSSKAGRSVFRTQMFAAAVFALIVGVAAIAVTYFLFFAQTNAADYLNCRTSENTGVGFFMYNVKFGSYVAILAGMTLALCVGTACFAVILGRYSSNIVNMTLKAVPVGAAIAVLALLALYYSFTSNNFLISGKFGRISGNVPYFEVVLCGAIAVIGIVTAAIVMIREKRVNVA